MITKQVRFRGLGEESFQGGIMVDDGSSLYVICGCCGGIYKMDDIEEISEFKIWINISDEIIGE